MTENAMIQEARSYWFVGAMYDGSDDQTPRFLKEGVWENGYEDRYLDLVKAIQIGDRIAIKSSYTRKHELPFDNRGHSVSVMGIKATGTVTANLGDGRQVKVDWTPLDSLREWYFFTHRATIWRVLPGDWTSDALIAFAFSNKPQDLSRFRNAPFWQERFGDTPTARQRFQWTRFYEAVAEKLLLFRQVRAPLIKAIHAIAAKSSALTPLQDQFADGHAGPVQDICPFTTFGIFNRGITDANRKKIAAELAGFLGVVEPIPETFEGIPILNNQRSWFFSYEKHRQPDDIDALWTVFESALRLADSDDPDARDNFIKAFDNATGRAGVAWNLTVGLYWISPWAYATLDTRSRRYLEDKLTMAVARNGNKHLPSGTDYLELLESLGTRFEEEVYPVHSFPELSLAAYNYKGAAVAREPDQPENEEQEESADIEINPAEPAAPIQPYSVDDILADGCFLERAKLVAILEQLRSKQNVILQGPPGTGKTWLAKRLAFALMGQRDESRLRVIQFHPNMSYEDFVRGWRPGGDGRLALVDGPFMEVIKAAGKTPSAQHIVVIEEINRGNPALIFGEMLTLMEADKRTPDEAIELCYRRTDGERVFIPRNVYIIGTMNIADRSLALVDLALRRRFAFADLEPRFGAAWARWVTSRCSVAPEVLQEIENRIVALNDQIKDDPTLGRQFRIGHSFVTPPLGIQITDFRAWYKNVVSSEIGPLLEEYWFDGIEKANDAKKRLLEGI
jgi:5-methylcytosine-specific restriction protein B